MTTNARRQPLTTVLLVQNGILSILDPSESLYPPPSYQASDFKRSLEKLGFGGLSSAEKSLLVRRFDPIEEGMVSARDVDNKYQINARC